MCMYVCIYKGIRICICICMCSCICIRTCIIRISIGLGIGICFLYMCGCMDDCIYLCTHVSTHFLSFQCFACSLSFLVQLEGNMKGWQKFGVLWWVSLLVAAAAGVASLSLNGILNPKS